MRGKCEVIFTFVHGHATDAAGILGSLKKTRKYYRKQVGLNF